MTLEQFVRGVGVASVALAAVGTVRPGALARAGGVVRPDAALPLLVRLASARQLAVGLALLTRSPVDVRRAAGLFLPLTVLDAGAVALAARQGVLRPWSAALSGAVLAGNVAVAVAGR